MLSQVAATLAATTDEPWWVWRLGSAGVGVVLAVRGVGGFFDGHLRPATRATPFFRLNRQVYSPLCLALATLIGLAA